MGHRCVFAIYNYRCRCIEPCLSSIQSRGQCHRSTVEDYSPALAPKARAFLSELKSAIKSGDRQKIAGLIRYPLEVNFVKGHRLVRTKVELVRDYDAIFTPATRTVVEQQVPACLFANYQGVMIGNREVWFEEQHDGTMKIKVLNPD
jgi:hypothetical protein